MDIELIKRSLPKYVLENGSFCLTAVGEKKPRDAVTYVPIGANEINKSFSEVESSKHLHYANCIGIKVGNNISAIDIDGCITDGKVSDFAQEIIDTMKSYTEISPSKTGIRILFLSKTLFDRNKWMIKNPKLKIEYYDADDQENNAGRMVRLSGNRFNEYELRAVNTESILNKYMLRNDAFLTEAVEEPVNLYKVRFINAVTKHNPDFVTLFGRAFNGLSESEWDWILVSNYYSLTDNKNEVRYLFEKSNYYRTKGDRHKKKWGRPDYSNYVLNMRYDATVEHPAKKYGKLFDTYTPEDSIDISKDLYDILYFARKFKILGKKFLQHVVINEINIDDQKIVDLLYFISMNHRRLEHKIQELIYALPIERE